MSRRHPSICVVRLCYDLEVARVIPVEDRRGAIVWVWDAPDVCPARHEDGTLMRWHVCPRCRRRDTAWESARDGCRAIGMDWDHDCDARAILGHGFPLWVSRALP